jgi:hypothetical protein
MPLSDSLRSADWMRRSKQQVFNAYSMFIILGNTTRNRGSAVPLDVFYESSGLHFISFVAK